MNEANHLFVLGKMKFLFVDTNICVQRKEETNKQTNKWNSYELLPNTFAQLWSHQLTITILRNDSGNNSNSIHGNSSFLTKLKHVPNICQNIEDIYTSGNQYSRFLYLLLTPPFQFSLSSLFRSSLKEQRYGKPWALQSAILQTCILFFTFTSLPIFVPFLCLSSVMSWMSLFIFSISLFYIRNVVVVGQFHFDDAVATNAGRILISLPVFLFTRFATENKSNG